MARTHRPRSPLAMPWFIAGVGALVSALSGCTAKTVASGSAADDVLQGSAVSQTRSLGGDQHVHVRGIGGAIKAQTTTSDTFTLEATKVGDGSLDAVRIVLEDTPDGVLVCAVYPNGNCSPEGSLGDFDATSEPVDVRFVVSVPSGSDLRAELINGSISATDMAGSVDASTVNGNLSIVTAAAVSAQTVNGSIDTTVTNPGPVIASLQTANGAIRLALGDSTSASLSANTGNGKIHSDFPLSVQAQGFGPSSALGTIGNGEGNVSLQTGNGSIEIDQLARL